MQMQDVPDCSMYCKECRVWRAELLVVTHRDDVVVREENVQNFSKGRKGFESIPVWS